MIYIYKLINGVTSDFYIGSTNNFKKRQRQHVYLLRHKKHTNRKLQNAFDKYGEAVFSFEVVDVVSYKEDRVKREQFWVDRLRPRYNVNLSIGDVHYPTPQAEVGRKISMANRGKKRPIDAVLRVAEWHRGKKRSAETCRRISESKRGKAGKKGIHTKPVVRIDLHNGGIKYYASTALAIDECGPSAGKALCGKYLFTNKKRYAWLSLGSYLKITDYWKWYKELTIKRELALQNERGKELVLNIENGIYFNSIHDAYISGNFKSNIDYFSRQLHSKRLNTTSFVLV